MSMNRNPTLRPVLLAATALAALLAPLAAQAQWLQSWSARVGVTQIVPDVTSGDLTPPSFAGTKADIRSATQLTGGITAHLGPNWSIDLPLALPFEHEILGDGAIAGVGKIGEVKALPITLLGQYRFLDAKAPVRPYVGLGVTYAKFFKARSTAALTALTGGTPANPTTLSMDSKFAATAQLGASVALKDRWSLNLSATYTPLKTRATLSTGQTLDAKLNPSSFSIELVHRY